MNDLEKFIIDIKYNNDSLLIDYKYIDSFKNINKEKLIKRNILVKYEEKYYLNYLNNDVSYVIENNSFNYIKNENIKNYIKEVSSQIINKYKSIKSIILIGSVSRNLNTIDSDFDFLVISSRKIKKIKIKKLKDYKLDFILKTTEEFKNEYNNNSELILWSLKYGIPLYDNKFLHEYRDYNKFKNFKNIVIFKLQQIKKYFIFEYEEILEKEDILYYFKKIYYYLLRLYLYKNNFIPKSKPELLKQISEHNLKDNLILSISDYLNKDKIEKQKLTKLLKEIESSIHLHNY
jgi:predicted nucleotidyltransferase